MEDGEEDYALEFDTASEPTPQREAPLESASSALPETPPQTPLARDAAPRSALEGYASPVVRPPTRPAPVPKRPVRSSLDQAPWLFTVHAKKIRSLRIPMAPAAAPAVGGLPVIGDLRVFATLDKEPMQTHGSRWKQDARVAESARSLIAVRRAPSLSSATSPGPRSGVRQEASWNKGDGDLQWSLTMDRFRRLKAYSPRVKLFVFGIGVNAQVESVRVLSEDSPRAYRESIVSLGWFFLDLRTPDLPERWFKLQNSPFGGEIFVSTSFTPVEVRRSLPDTSQEDAATRSSTSQLVDPTRRREHSTSADSEYLRLGSHDASDVFLFTAFIRTAMSLVEVVRSSFRNKEDERTALKAGFWLSYSLFGVVVQTDVFYNLDQAEFAPIRDTFRVLSSKTDVREFLKSQDRLSIYLCTHERVLANADIAFDKMIGLGSFLTGSADEENVSIEDTFRFGTVSEGGVLASFSVERNGTALIHGENHNHDEEVKSIGDDNAVTSLKAKEALHRSVCISVRYIKLSSDLLTTYAEKESIELEIVWGEHAVRCPIRFNAFTAEHALGECTEASLSGQASISDESVTISVACTTSVTDYTIALSAEEHHRVNTEDDIQLSLSHDSVTVGKCVLYVREMMPTTGATCTHSEQSLANHSMPRVSHAYRLLIQLKSLRNFKTSQPIVISYKNPFTGHEIVETSPIVVPVKVETEVPDAYCLFVVHQDESGMKEAMEASIVMEVSITLPDGSREAIGCAVFSLNFLYYSPEIVSCAAPGCDVVFTSDHEQSKHWQESHQDLIHGEMRKTTYSRRRCSIYLPVMHADGRCRALNPLQRAGGIQIEAHLDDCGPMSDLEISRVEEMRVPQVVLPDNRIYTLKRTEFSTALEPQTQNIHDRVRADSRATGLDSTSAAIEIDRDRTPVVETERDLIEIKSQLSRERSAWLQEQKIQQAHWKKRIADIEKARMDELEEEWARREEERSLALRTAQGEYHELERKLRETLGQLETRERKLALAEVALERDQRMLREDSDLLRKRLQAEQIHSLSLAQKQVEALEKRVYELQQQLAAAEKRSLQVEEDFAEYRKQQRKIPEFKLRDEISSLKFQISDLEKTTQSAIRAREHAEFNTSKMRTQLEKMAKLVQAEKKRAETQALDEIEKLRLKYIAREERYVLDGDREELRAIKQQLDELRRLHVSGSYDGAGSHQSKLETSHRKLRVLTRRRHNVSSISSKSSPSPRYSERRRNWSLNEPSPLEKAGHQTDHVTRHVDRMIKKSDDQEIRRLQSERDALLDNGAFDQNSYLVRELERRIILRRDLLGQPHT